MGKIRETVEIVHGEVREGLQYIGELKAPSLPPKLVVIESPYAGNVRRNMAYLRAAMLDSLQRGEAPYASHALYTQVLDDDVPDQRATGIQAGLAWGDKAEATVCYCDLGVSSGMKMGIARATAAGRPIEYRTLPDWVWPPRKTT